MKFLIHSLETLKEFQKQCIHVRFPELPHGVWKPDISSILFESVRFTILNPKEANRSKTVQTILLTMPHFIVGSSLLHTVHETQGGEVRFPMQDLLKIWTKRLHLPKTLAMQEFLEKIFHVEYELYIEIVFETPQSLYTCDIPYKVCPVLEVWIEPMPISIS